MRRFHRSWREQKARRDERWIVLLWLIEALVLRRRALFLWRPTMAVSFDAAAAGGVSPSVTNLTINITIGSSANRAILVMVATDSAAGTTTVTNGTDTFSAISGADVTQGTIHLLAFGAITSLTGAQTITITPQNTGHPLQAGVLTFSGVDQTTPFNNGNATSNTGASPISLAVTSVNGDLTSSAIAQDGPGAGSVTTNQTSRYTNSAAAGLGGDTGPGTGNTTHT